MLDIRRINERTKRIVIEIANFSHYQIYYSINFFKVKTETSYRFERRVDFTNTQSFIQYLTNCIKINCFGKINLVQVIYGSALYYINMLSINLSYVEKILGEKINIISTEEILFKLGFVKYKNNYEIPSWRQGDVVNQECIAEEIVRMSTFFD